MEMLQIEIPENYKIDLEKSDLSKGIIVFKELITYEEICKMYVLPTFMKERYERAFAALKKLLIVAKYLNGGWSVSAGCHQDQYHIVYYSHCDEFAIREGKDTTQGAVYFKTRELALKAIDILGEETIYQALLHQC